MKLYPKIKSYNTFMLRVDKLHKIFVEESGNPKGIPVMCLHGGPGCPMKDGYKRIMDPKRFRIISFHQRGCGKSIPHACLLRNQSKYLVQDMEKIRKHLGISKWIVHGGSWGGTLTLLYGIKHPSKCIALVPFSLSIFDCYTERSTHTMVPDLHQEWKLNVQKSDKQNMKMYLDKLKSSNKTTQKKYMKKWNHVESKLFQLMNFPQIIKPKKGTVFKLSPKDQYTTALFECYYYYNRGFIKNTKWLLKQIQKKLKNVKGYIVHGRFDLICSPVSAHTVHKHWEKSKLYICDLSGHGEGDRGNAETLLKIFKILGKRKK